ncbi:MAG: TatD family hydrolase [Synergistaceae bacterium]|nr:TatD family hydrolase [Synergistaceae bacterium]
MLIDSHCHINSEDLRTNASEVVERAFENNVKKMVIVGCDLEDSLEAVELAHKFNFYASIGIHPHEAKRYEDIPQEFYKLIQDEKVIAIGEIGLDYHYDLSPRDVQAEIFERQLKFAQEINKPVILHIREAMGDAMKILREYKNLKFLFHCYAGGLEFLDEVLEFNSLCAFGGALTWKGKASEELREVFRKIPNDRILLETDCPYMAPVPMRGKTNEPAFIKFVYERAAQEKNLSLEELEKIIEKNFRAYQTLQKN